ncbi:TPA: hypothetical protein TVE67_001202 [Streptococcus equi subsp. zooepidemicus]|nr:hypothetical protein [Streptococcus equi subsp. zooepidemicus]HEL0635967.1 hypothetical protein [Streptococcus equi subsp. zooepidemicus]HEL0652602.1 hypothetical protein [Streptococcus equi subsp. zooepidemicus]HEL0694144.1 hypothetical protein [Streptococcus equi subsp. zooepidemicus]HEL0772971.1 hypothetical protein [Streptococcus equi subsp. zooepidemicus]
MTQKQSNLTVVAGTQQLEFEFWKNYPKELIQKAIDGNAKELLHKMVEYLSTIAVVAEAYIIIHNKDWSEVWNPSLNKYEKVLKTIHVHFLFKLAEGATLPEIANALGLETQYLEKPKSGRYAYDNLLSYLIHAKEPDKFFYSPSEVVTLMGRDYQIIYNERIRTWEKGRAKKTSKQAKNDVEALIMDIIKGKIKKDEILNSPEFYAIYAFNKSKLNEAFETYAERKSLKTYKDLELGLFQKTIIFLQGASGLGKTTLAKELAHKLQFLSRVNGEDWETVITAATNPFDDVRGEEIILLDDVRGQALSASDWLKLLDPFTASPISSRFKNRSGAVKTIIITSSKSALEFFFKTKDSGYEDLSQFVRRINHFITLRTDSSGNIIYSSSFPERKHTPIQRKIPNKEVIVSLDYDFSTAKEMSSEDLLEFLIETVRLNNHWEISYQDSKKAITTTDQSKSDDLNQ